MTVTIHDGMKKYELHQTEEGKTYFTILNETRMNQPMYEVRRYDVIATGNHLHVIYLDKNKDGEVVECEFYSKDIIRYFTASMY